MGLSAPSSRLLGPGDRLGKYELIRQVAIGGMAELYLARTQGIEGFEKIVVLKRILPQNVDSQNFVNMFLNEARLAAGLHHPNIAQVFDIGVDQSDYFFTMEYIHGEDLGRIAATALDSGVPLSLDAALTLACGLCAGLHYAHEKLGTDGTPLRIVHRDVSPSNVLVTYDGAVKLVDFGIARASVGPHTQTGQSQLKGKVSYMSPEQCRGKSLDRRSDLFSIGVILYELTTGTNPFTDKTNYATLEKIVSVDPPPPSQLVPSFPEALERILQKALARDPDKRYASALALQGDLEDFAHESRLRISPLVLARVMSTLFPARLEEWERARAQGAFFVEQAVVRTWIEKTGDGEPPLPEPAQEPQPPPPDETTARLPTPLPFPAPDMPRLATPPAGLRRPTPRVPTAVPSEAPSYAPATAGVLATHGNEPTAAVVPLEFVSSTTYEETKLVRVPSRRFPVAIITLAGCAVAGVLAAVLLVGGKSTPQHAASVPPPAPPPVAQPAVAPEPTPPPAPPVVDPPAKDPEPATTKPPADPIPEPPKPDPIPDPPKPDPVKQDPPKQDPPKQDPPKQEPAQQAHKRPVVAPQPPVKTVPKPTPSHPTTVKTPPKPATPKPDPATKEKEWSDTPPDGVFLPQRPGR